MHTPTSIIDALNAGPVGATLCYPQDKHPYVVISSSPSGKTLRVEALRHVDKTTGHEPREVERNGGFPIWDHYYTDEELASFRETHAHVTTLRWSAKREGYYAKRIPFAVGHARLYRDHSY